MPRRFRETNMTVGEDPFDIDWIIESLERCVIRIAGDAHCWGCALLGIQIG
jgi:hypothetical protein